MEFPAFTRARTLLRWALWMSLLSGLGQAAAVTALRLLTDRLVLVSRDVVWMAPLANLLVFGSAMLVARAVTAGARPATAARAMLFVCLFLLALGPMLMAPSLHIAAKLALCAGIGVQGTRLLRPRFAFIDGIVKRTLPVLFAICVALAAGIPIARSLAAKSVEASLPQAAAGSPNVILVVLDTVRTSSLGLYGYGRPTSPNLERLAREGVVFERALANSSWTLPSHASLFTGRLPHDLSADWLRPLDAANLTLAEAFAARGYATAGFAANVLYATSETGLARGFLHYEDYPRSAGMILRESWLTRPLVLAVRRAIGIRSPLVSRNAESINTAFDSWLIARPNRPFFAFLNYFDAHAPYMPPAPFNAKFGAGGPQPDPMVRRQWSAEEIQRSMDAYDGAVAYVDRALGLLMDRIRAAGLADNTLVVVTSDHGEQFGEHGLFDHGNGLYRQTLQVPLVIRFPGRVPADARVAEPVSLVDLGATLLDLAGGGAGAFPGRSLAATWGPDTTGERTREPLFAEIRRGINLPPWLPASKGTMESVVLGGTHYIRNGDGTEELYDFERDVAESRNLAGSPEGAAALTAARQALISRAVRK